MRAMQVLQKVATNWALAAFGKEFSGRKERAMRLLEEAIEVAQAENVDRGYITVLTDNIYSKPPGKPSQELGGVGVCMLLYAESIGLDAEEETAREVLRVTSFDPSYFRARHQKKLAEGKALPAEPVPICRANSSEDISVDDVCHRCNRKFGTGCGDAIAAGLIRDPLEKKA